MNDNILGNIWNDLAIELNRIPKKNSDIKCYINNPHSFKVSDIINIKQNGPATIIFLRNGEKVIVKCQDDKVDRRLGLLMCLIKYLVPTNRVYSNCIDRIFMNEEYLVHNGFNIPIMIAEAIVVSYIGERDLDNICYKFFSEEN